MELHTVKQRDTSSSAASNLKTDEKTIALYNADARLMAEFEQSGMSGNFFNYCKSVPFAPTTISSEDEMTAYLTKIQRGGFVQSFGCMIAVEEPNFSVIGYSENCFDMLGVTGVVVGGKLSLIGVDATTFFTTSSTDSLAKAVASREISFLNPVLVHSRSNHRPFYAILHRIDVGIVMDLEPGHGGDPTAVHAGAVQSQRLAVRAITRLQSLPEGDVGALCDAVVEDIQRLTGYDRVMAYKFHEDNHGEVVAEIRRSDLDPFLGLHYPATDIPQAVRFLFQQNRVRMIHNCKDKPVRIIQNEKVKQPICLVNSTLRAPYGCHTQYMENMGSIASLVMAVIIKNDDSKKLWGLVVCHHTSPRYVSFPLRYACEFLMQAFSLQLYMELQVASQMAEKKMIHMQTLLSDMLLRDAPICIVTQSPNIMDLVKCDGAALYYGGKCWLLGVTPVEAQLNDIVEWLLSTLGDNMGLSTDSLANAGYPGAASLGDAICGMAAARIFTRDFVFWFRSHTAKELKWGGAKHHPEDKDDSEKMNPRSSFNAFLEIAKSKSIPWETVEINAIHSLQIIMRDAFQDIEDNVPKSGLNSNSDGAHLVEIAVVATEMARLIETSTVPIFGVDSFGLINGWNAKMCELTGLELLEAIGKSLVPDIVHDDSCEVAENLLAGALKGKEDKNVEVKLRKFGEHVANSVVYLVVNTCISRDYKNNIVGVCFVSQDVTIEKTAIANFIRMQGDYQAIIQSVNNVIPPIFASDENACCSEWNAVMEKLTGWMRHEIIGKTLPGEIFGSFCRLKDQDVLTKFMILLYRAISGHDAEKLAFGFFNREGKFVEVYLTAYKRVNESGKIFGCLFLLQIMAISQKESTILKQDECEELLISKKLAYIMQEVKNPLNGISFTHKLLESSTISDDQKKFLETSNACERQILSIIDDTDIGSFEEGMIDLKVKELILGDVVDAIVSQAMILLREKDLHLIHDIPEEIKSLCVCGDQMKLQLILSDFLLCIVEYAPSPDGWVEIEVSPVLKLIQDGNEFVHLKFRMAHPGQGLPHPLIEEMFGAKNQCMTQEGITLNISRKLLGMMNGNVRYFREQNKNYLEIELELPLRDPKLHGFS
ncbi:LOW QUALITY PROTEIN: phytochrome E-like [Salvia miltiorrhiza]|uniref:LOW QUALITY PROTEIN: phytochrome E-like n=1 Tax=Salvia miltiorrhiza TaxID=226208 RepID=UPI0025AC0395|nr:LOW QUALITY PROTEIN: phytochrome E-like [Salvia miltiorrhiza]